ncbi:hypothetical protein [Phormidium sp. CCY1219]|uniref:hypothetical protein n=1 Tax=Phormidium sp. CCY1219 TaxID=2886104 RepID=UPI002D1F6BDA|nr:hypothetical protein [Phormidium sp. CCY1219]MEB3828828.1 hypothetical protein [Phormidium sp. CCY1219]
MKQNKKEPLAPQLSRPSTGEVGSSRDGDPLLEFASRCGQHLSEQANQNANRLAEFYVRVIQNYRPCPDKSSPQPEWLMAKAREWEDRCKPINPRLESRSKEELLEFIITCAVSEGRTSQV